MNEALNPNNCHKIWERFPVVVHCAGADQEGKKRPLCGTSNPKPLYAKTLDGVTCRSCTKRSKRS